MAESVLRDLVDGIDVQSVTGSMGRRRYSSGESGRMCGELKFESHAIQLIVLEKFPSLYCLLNSREMCW